MDRLKEILSKSLGIASNEIKMEMTPDDIDAWDSIKQLELLRAIENEFKITFEIMELFEIMSIEDIFHILQRKGVLQDDI